MNKPSAKSVIAVAIAVLAVAAGAYFFTASQRDSTAASPPKAAPKPALTVTAALPESTRLPITLAANGNIAAWQEAIIGAESSGLRLTEVRVNVGDVVKAGQVLATFSHGQRAGRRGAGARQPARGPGQRRRCRRQRRARAQPAKLGRAERPADQPVFDA